MDKSYSSSSNFYNIYYKDDKNKKHITFNLTQKDLNFILSYYGKDNVYSIEKQLHHLFNGKNQKLSTL